MICMCANTNMDEDRSRGIFGFQLIIEKILREMIETGQLSVVSSLNGIEPKIYLIQKEKKKKNPDHWFS